MNKRTYFIYKYSFPNGKVYIGQTYKGSRRYGKVSDYIGTLVYRAMKKYPNFEKEIIEYCDESIVDSREKYWIAFYNSSHRDYGYNRDSGGNTNKRLSEDLKHQLSLSHQGMYAKPVLQFDLHGNFIKEWTSEKEVERVLGITINACCTGRQKTAGGFQWKLKEDSRIIEDIYNPIEQYGLDGTFIKEWGSISEASEQTKTSEAGIISCCKGKNKSAGGFQWKRKKDERILGKYIRLNSSTSFAKGRVPHNKGVGRKVLQYDLNGHFIKKWDCIATAQKELKVFGVSEACKSKKSFAGGFLWKYEDDKRTIEPYVRPTWTISEETKRKLSLSKKGKPNKRKGLPGMGGVKNPRATPILQYSLDGVLIKEWEYISLAAKACNIAPSTITGALKGYQKTAGGYKWKYR